MWIEISTKEAHRDQDDIERAGIVAKAPDRFGISSRRDCGRRTCGRSRASANASAYASARRRSGPQAEVGRAPEGR